MIIVVDILMAKDKQGEVQKKKKKKPATTNHIRNSRELNNWPSQ